MTSCYDEDETLTVTTLTVTNHVGSKEKRSTVVNKIDVALTAKMKGAKNIEIIGPAGPFPMLGVDTGAWHFDFTLDDQTGKTVGFTTLDAEDDCQTCPKTIGNNSKLITGERVEPNDPTIAHFIDNNNNNSKKGVVNVGFQWHFSCDDPSITVGTYDPVVPNGGKT